MKNGIAVVTGATGAIGRAVAELIHQKSRGRLRVAVHCLSKLVVAEALARRIPGSFVVAADLSTDEGRHTLMQKAGEQGPLSVLVQCAGGQAPHEAALRIREESFDRVLALELKAPLFMMQQCASSMAGSGGGVIVNIGSILSRFALTGAGTFRAAKSALEVLTKQFASELGRSGVRVNMVSPGVLDAPPAQAGPEPVLAVMREQTAAKAFASPQAVAEAVWHLIENDHINGAVLPVDGGMLL